MKYDLGELDEHELEKLFDRHDFFSKTPGLWRGKNVLDLGCGTKTKGVLE